jgi:hypothetical protein
MGERRSLVAGVETTPHGVDPDLMRAFISQEKSPTLQTKVPVLPVNGSEAAGEEEEQPLAPDAPHPEVPASVSRHETGPGRKPGKPVGQKRARTAPLHSTLLVPVTVRLKPEIADALKRASLERQLNGLSTYTQQDIVEDALVPWLRSEGLLD